jgi:hypothetical protein
MAQIETVTLYNSMKVFALKVNGITKSVWATRGEAEAAMIAHARAS